MLKFNRIPISIDPDTYYNTFLCIDTFLYNVYTSEYNIKTSLFIQIFIC